MESSHPPSSPPSPATLAFRRLAQRVEDEGLYKTDLGYYWRIAAWLVLLLGSAFWLAAHGYVVAGALTTALFWQQVGGAWSLGLGPAPSD